MLIMQIGSSLAGVTIFSLLLTVLTSPPSSSVRYEFLVELYLWPFVLADATCSHHRRAYQRIFALLLWLVLGRVLWLVWQWPLAVFLPAFAIGLPIIWVIGAVLVIMVYTAAERPFLPSHS